MNSVQMGAAVLRAAEPQIAVVVVTHPNDAQQVGGISREPAVVRTARSYPPQAG